MRQPKIQAYGKPQERGDSDRSYKVPEVPRVEIHLVVHRNQGSDPRRSGCVITGLCDKTYNRVTKNATTVRGDIRQRLVEGLYNGRSHRLGRHPVFAGGFGPGMSAFFMPSVGAVGKGGRSADDVDEGSFQGTILSLLNLRA